MIPRELEPYLTQFGSTRLDCLRCGHKNTLSINNFNGTIQWNCFHASCKFKGISSIARSIQEIRNVIHEEKKYPTDTQNCPEWTEPEYFTSVLSSPSAVKYMRSYNCMSAFIHHRVRIRFDPKLSRIVFLCEDNQRIVGAVGRQLSFDKSQPKWHMYGHNNLFVTKCLTRKDTAILVEDAASACAVSGSAVGVALLGTSLSPEHISRLKQYKHVIICLDPDATRKALAISRLISFYIHSSIIRLEDDLKYFDEKQIEKIVDEHIHG